ncbi:MAG: imidazoleglycerol-phosphate dehydratase HisB [Christensenellales bacterium]|jgi:imidazoleglycerol-phosphate dehydratase
MNRQAQVARRTAETDITLTLRIDGSGQADVDTGVGFLDHMLTLLARHGGMDLTVRCAGDTRVDCHHTVEDVGLCLGEALRSALGDKRGIVRYGTFHAPMDESLARVALDLSGRPYLVFDAPMPAPRVGDFDTEMVEDFFRAVSNTGGITLHIASLYGRNTHHIIEGLFKAFGRALRKACEPDPRMTGIPSTKGSL